MANNAAALQLPIMVRNPKMVWPGLDKEGRHLKSIAGDGNCLFASLSDQLYGTPGHHGEIRASVIEHMRTFRPLYEDFILADDVVQKRATRATTESVRKQMDEDVFDGYLNAMSRLGTYGGQPELLAFVRAYDQDVVVHLPPVPHSEGNTIDVINDHRETGLQPQNTLHICYGGDEEKRAHYDSSQKSKAESHSHVLTTRPKPEARQNDPNKIEHEGPSPRAVRNMKSDPSRDMMHEFVTKGNRELKSSYDILSEQRARSPSTSSHYSTSSKRSFDDDGEQPRSCKRIDKKKRSLRSRTVARNQSGSPSLTIPTTVSQPTSSGPPTPTSSQGTDSSTEQVDHLQDDTRIVRSSAPLVISLIDDEEEEEEEADEDDECAVSYDDYSQPRLHALSSPAEVVPLHQQHTNSRDSHPIKEDSRTTLRT